MTHNRPRDAEESAKGFLRAVLGRPVRPDEIEDTEQQIKRFQPEPPPYLDELAALLDRIVQGVEPNRPYGLLSYTDCYGHPSSLVYVVEPGRIRLSGRIGFGDHAFIARLLASRNPRAVWREAQQGPDDYLLPYGYIDWPKEAI